MKKRAPKKVPTYNPDLRKEEKLGLEIAALFERRNAIIDRGLGDSFTVSIGQTVLVFKKDGLHYL